MIEYTWEDVKQYSVGDIFKLKGKNYKLTRRGACSAVIQRWYWFDPLLDRLRVWWLGRPNDI